MGIRNRERRRAKNANKLKRRKAQEQTQGHSNQEQTQGHSNDDRQHRSAGAASWSQSATELDERLVDEMILSAAHARCEQRDNRDRLVDFLVQGAGTGPGASLVASRLSNFLVRDITMALRGGWEPEEIARYVRRKTSAAATRVTAAYIGEAARHCSYLNDQESWEQQITNLIADSQRLDCNLPSWRTDVDASISALGVLQHLSKMPDLSSIRQARRKARSQEEERLLARVRALLAKAESSEFPEEADALMAKAQQLMTGHCLDRALLENDGGDSGEGSQVDARRCWLDDPYIEAKGFLLHVVAKANRCKAVLSTSIGFVTIVGHPDDLDASELLFTSLLVQATRRMTAAPADPAHSSRSRRPAYRRSFLVAYATRIGTRLDEANSSATAQAAAANGRDLLPVLAQRDDDVDHAVHKLFGKLGGQSLAASDPAGWVAGTAAADMADLVVQEEIDYKSVS
ncbi:MAG: DUF2786 domain-containing protein [Actinomycetota bacterium]|jgi:hypothetical protein|nr:DUF2786 domain-containing protein [Actinomycetota bacterium]